VPPFDQELKSSEEGMEAPLGCDVEVAMVDVDAAEEVEEMEDEELFLCRLFLGMSIRLRLSVLTICPLWLPFTPFIPQVGLLCWAKVGGLATAVMREAVLESVRWELDGEVGHSRGSLRQFTAQVDRVENSWPRSYFYTFSLLYPCSGDDRSGCSIQEAKRKRPG
jgi:hypothetical protein